MLLTGTARMKKELSLFNVYAIALGTTLSSGFFLLPGIAAAVAGPAMIASYAIAVIPLIPATFSILELGTAMPRAGGAYYFLDRSMGPLIGTIGGIGTWIALMLKIAFALIGIGAYLGLFTPHIDIIPLAMGFALLIGVLNLLGARRTGALQTVFVVVLLLIIGAFMGAGITRMKPGNFSGFFANGFDAAISTAGLVCISYIGILNVMSVSEDVKKPERNLPLGVFLALTTAFVVYAVGSGVMVGVLGQAKLANDYTPAATTAERILGHPGAVVITVAAILAFLSVANGGILSASRYPLAMSRDRLMPGVFSRLSRFRTPTYAVLLTVGIIILFLNVLDPARIAKLASAFQLLMFALISLAVVVMRESRIESYDPGVRSPCYPWMQIAGFVLPVVLIVEMGELPLLFTLALVSLGTVWFAVYARGKLEREGAVFHVFERLGRRRCRGLDWELRGILKEKGLREEDLFADAVSRAPIVDLADIPTFEDVVGHASALLSRRLNMGQERLVDGFMKGTRIGATPIAHGAALPHLRLPNIECPEIVMMRSQPGVAVRLDDDLHEGPPPEKTIHAFFFLVSPERDSGQHLRMLAHLASRIDQDGFLTRWLSTRSDRALKGMLLSDENVLCISIQATAKTGTLIGRKVRTIELPRGALIAAIHRKGQRIIPGGETVLHEMDDLLIIGDPPLLQEISDAFNVADLG